MQNMELQVLSNISEILEAFIQVENKKYQETFKYEHMPTLGALYESLTGEVVSRALPKGLNLFMSSGFIYDDTGYKSGEIDQMLVRGEGRSLGYTEKREHHIKDVLAVFEVKKTLNKSDLIDAYGHLHGISRAFSNYFEEYLRTGVEVDISYAAKSFAQITGKDEPRHYSDMHNMPENEGIILYSLIQETKSPISIIHGYGGYKTEKGLRDVFLNFLSDKTNQPGFGVPAIPNIISSGNFSLVKTTGMPFKNRLIKDQRWPVLCSSRDNVIKMMMETIWTKISIYCDVSMPWGEDLDADVMANLLSAKFIRDDSTNKKGWMYFSIDIKESELSKISRVEEWEPFIARGRVGSLAVSLCMNGGSINTLTDNFLLLAGNTAAARDSFIDDCLESCLFSLGDDNYISFIGESMHLQQLDDGSYAMSDDSSRLTSWCKKNGIERSFINFINTERMLEK
jgi:uncharacterized protein DUF6602